MTLATPPLGTERADRPARAPAPDQQPEGARAERRLHHVLRPAEAWILPRIARALPRWVLPDHLTALGAASAFAIGACYALSGKGAGFLWAANGLLVVNWLGDSLDGTLARVRRIERPRYGFYLDHLTDMFSVAAVCLGLGLSPYLRLPVALGLLMGFYLLSMNVYLETHVLGRFDFGYGRVGPTELRILLFLGGSLLALGLIPEARLPVLSLSVVELAALGGLALVVLLVLSRMIGNLRTLARLEPPNVVKAGQRDAGLERQARGEDAERNRSDAAAPVTPASPRA